MIRTIVTIFSISCLIGNILYPILDKKTKYRDNLFLEFKYFNLFFFFWFIAIFFTKQIKEKRKIEDYKRKVKNHEKFTILLSNFSNVNESTELKNMRRYLKLKQIKKWTKNNIYNVKEFLTMVRNLPEEVFNKLELKVFDCYNEENIDITIIERNHFNENKFQIIINE